MLSWYLTALPPPPLAQSRCQLAFSSGSLQSPLPPRVSFVLPRIVSSMAIGQSLALFSVWKACGDVQLAFVSSCLPAHWPGGKACRVISVVKIKPLLLAKPAKQRGNSGKFRLCVLGVTHCQYRRCSGGEIGAGLFSEQTRSVCCQTVALGNLHGIKMPSHKNQES